MFGRGRRQNKVFHEQRLHRTAEAAGAAFGCMETESLSLSGPPRRSFSLMLSTFAAFPLAIGVAAYLIR